VNVGSMLAAALLALGAASPTHAEGPAGAVAEVGLVHPNFYSTLPMRSVDHVVTYAAWRWGPKDGDRVVLMRRGMLVREDTHFIGSRRKNEATDRQLFYNLKTGGSVDIVPGTRIQAASLQIGKASGAAASRYRHEVVPTGAFDTIAGERCAVWAEKDSPGRGASRSACVTSDGIVLRDKVAVCCGGMMELRAIHVERRTVRLADILPPREALDWARWAAAAAATRPIVPSQAPSNYALSLAGYASRWSAERIAKIYRSDGVWKSVEYRGVALSLGSPSDANKVDSSGIDFASARKIEILGPNIWLNYDRVDASLQIARSPERAWWHPDYPSAPLAKESGTALGERCDWFNATVDVADYSGEECRTSDGLPVIIIERQRGHPSDNWTATSLRRGQTPQGSVRPPGWMMSWAFWGWPEVAGGK
jgi:hypothetical protein